MWATENSRKQSQRCAFRHVHRVQPRPPSGRLDVLGFELAYEDYRDLFADPEVDAVSIASPNFLHHEIALAAIEAGKPFWIEKPIGVNAAQSREIALAAQKAGLVSAVGFN